LLGFVGGVRFRYVKLVHRIARLAFQQLIGAGDYAAQPKGPTWAGGVIVAKIVLAIAIGIVGVFFLANGFQASPGDHNWFGQSCWAGLCIHPEWIAIGAGLIACGVAVWKGLVSTPSIWSDVQGKLASSGSSIVGRPDGSDWLPAHSTAELALGVAARAIAAAGLLAVAYAVFQHH
jgi:hypothetical protein